MFDQKSLELKVGLFTLIGIILAVFFVLKASDVKILSRGYYLRFRFPYVSGLKVNSPIRLAGVPIGDVRDVVVDFDKKNNATVVDVLGFIKEGVVVPADSKVDIIPVGLLGDKGIEITPGIEFDNPMRPNDTLYGNPEVTFQDIMAHGEDIAIQIETTLTQLNKILQDEDVLNGLKRSLNEFSSAASNLSSLAESGRNILEDVRKGEGTVGRLLYDDTLYILMELMVFDISKEATKLIREIRANPWKLLVKTRNKKVSEETRR